MIRQMREQDITQVLDIEQAAFSVPWSAESFLRALAAETNIYLVAEQEQRIVGYCGLWVSYETADLCNLAVAAAYRQQGIAERLLREGLCRAAERAAEEVLLEVRRSNLPAIRLYEKTGFCQIGVRSRYYRNPTEDAILMQLKLAEDDKEMLLETHALYGIGRKETLCDGKGRKACL